MRLFDEMSRTDRQPAPRAEGMFRYLNRSARPAFEAARVLLESWFERYPDFTKADLRARFRSSDDAPHQGALFELILHELLLSMGFTVTVHPTVPGGESRHPDFLVRRENEGLFYLEATLALPARDEAAADARRNQVYDVLDQMDSPNFFLALDLEGAPATPPPAARLRQDLAQWLATLDPEEVASRLATRGWDHMPAFSWGHDGWEIVFRAFPKSPELRGHEGVRPIGVLFPSANFITSHVALRSSVVSKATRYGELELPFVVAVNVIDDFVGEIDVRNGLFGEECVIDTRHADGTIDRCDGRSPNGALRGPKGPRNTRVSAVLVGIEMMLWNLATNTPRLYQNPWAAKPLSPDLWPMPQLFPGPSGDGREVREGRKIAELLGLPEPWPVPD